MNIRLVIADDHPLILDGLNNLFLAEPDFQIMACCTNGEEALQAVRSQRPDIVVLDIRMPGQNGLDVIRQMRQEQLPPRVVLLTAELDDRNLVEALSLGVQGIVLKEMAPCLLVQCIRKVHEGGQWLERKSTQQAMAAMLRREAGGRDMAGLLSVRERDIVRLVVCGLRNKGIAEKLSISEGTVKTHLHNIYEKLQVDSRLALVRFAQEKGMV